MLRMLALVGVGVHVLSGLEHVQSKPKGRRSKPAEVSYIPSNRGTRAIPQSHIFIIYLCSYIAIKEFVAFIIIFASVSSLMESYIPSNRDSRAISL